MFRPLPFCELIYHIFSLDVEFGTGLPEDIDNMFDVLSDASCIDIEGRYALSQSIVHRVCFQLRIVFGHP
jgi:hypothetical protein